MALFNFSFFSNSDNDAEKSYLQGVHCLQKGANYEANELLKKAAIKKHPSALYNLALLNGGGSITPFDIDFAAQCLRDAAQHGHPKANEFVVWLDKAEDTSFGTEALTMFAARSPSQGEPNHLLMMVGCKLYSALCIQYEATKSVIDYELDAANTSPYKYVHKFIERTGVKRSSYSGGLNRLDSGSAADQITDGLNSLCIGLKQSGHTEDLIIMIRCTIVGYIISKSRYASNAAPLLGFDKFFRA